MFAQNKHFCAIKKFNLGQMFINAIGHYLPSERVDNAYFEKVNGLSDEWIVSRTGIKTRSKASKEENNHTMGLNAIENALPQLPYPIEEVDLIIHASYSPLDTVATLAHIAQQKYYMENAKAFYISSACSSFVNAVEIVQTYFSANKASKALVIASEHNTIYSHENCEKSGHLWGDGAAAVFISKEKIKDNEAQIIDVVTRGLGHIGKGPEGVYLQPKEAGLVMPDGRDVFQNACGNMIESLSSVLNNNGLNISDLNYIIPHQANQRIVSNISRQLKLDLGMFLGNIEELGNTGSASTPIVLSQNWNNIKQSDLVGITVFGGGYSSGALLVQK